MERVQRDIVLAVAGVPGLEVDAQATREAIVRGPAGIIDLFGDASFGDASAADGPAYLSLTSLFTSPEARLPTHINVSCRLAPGALAECTTTPPLPLSLADAISDPVYTSSAARLSRSSGRAAARARAKVRDSPSLLVPLSALMPSALARGRNNSFF